MLLESVPNVSEGRRPRVVERLAAAAASIPGAHLLDRSADPDHNRSVLTLAGEPGPLERALLALFEVAVAEIDLAAHHGVHPRVGAVDVTPFVPLAGARPEDAVAAARSLGRRVAERFGLAVYLYGWAASTPERGELPAIRQGGVEGLAERMADPAWRPDFGPARVDPRSGVAVVGARDVLVAFNAELDSGDLSVARRVARAVREASGGLPAVRALGLPLASRGRTQVSMNLVDFRRTDAARALVAVEQAAGALGARVLATEIVGLAPREALGGADPAELKLRPECSGQILEERLRRAGLA